MRLFTAIELPLESRQHLSKALHRLLHGIVEHNLRPTALDNIHITLRFLGDVAESRIPNLCDRLAQVHMEPASLFADRFVFLPPRGKVRIIAAGFAGETETLARFQQKVERACVGMGFAAETRPYLPHATLARNKPGRYEKVASHLRNRDAEATWPGPSFRVESFSLMQSDLRSGGAVYVCVARFPIAKPS